MVSRAAAEAPYRIDRDPLPVVVVYTHSLLERSMTFIRSHSESLDRYRPVYAGSHRVQGLELPAERVFTANSGGFSGKGREYLFRRFGITGQLAVQLRKFRPSLVHAHFGQSGPAGLAIAESLGVPLIVTFHGQDATVSVDQSRRSWRGREFLRGRQRVMERASLIIAVSDFIREKLLEQGYPEDRVVTHRNGIDTGSFSPTGRKREQVAVFVGRFVEKKGCEYLVRALGRLQADGTQLRGVLIGDGPLRPALERLARDVGADVEFTGFMQPAEVRHWLERACVAVVPSVTAADGNSEGLPTVILEAQAMGTPVIATRHAGNAEGLAEGRSALLVDERDVEGLARSMRYFRDDKQAVESYGRAGREFVTDRFDIKTHVAGIERIYDRVRKAS